MGARWIGLEELKTALRTLPDDLTGEAGHIVEGSANAAVTTIKSGYAGHVVSGRLLNGVEVINRPAKRFTAAVYVSSKSPIAWLFDNGSQARHWAGGKSTGAMWGKTPPTHVFVRTVIIERRRMYEELRHMLMRHGASTVTGEA